MPPAPEDRETLPPPMPERQETAPPPMREPRETSRPPMREPRETPRPPMREQREPSQAPMREPRETPPQPPRERRPAEPMAVQEAIEEVNHIIETLRSTLVDMEDVLETLELAERQKIADEQEIETLRRGLRQLHRPSDRGQQPPRH
jgi:hypothetical protein